MRKLEKNANINVKKT